MTILLALRGIVCLAAYRSRIQVVDNDAMALRTAITMNIYRPANWLPALLALALTACGNGDEQLEPETPDGDVPSYEQLNPPVPEPGDSSTAPAVPDRSRQEETVPLPGPAGEKIVPPDESAAPANDGIATP